MNDFDKGIKTNLGAIVKPTRQARRAAKELGIELRPKSKIKRALKKAAKIALRKIGVSVYDRIFEIPCPAKDFNLIINRKRSILIAEYDENFKIGSFIRLRELKTENRPYTGREAHYFIKDILGPGIKGLFPAHCVLVLE